MKPILLSLIGSFFLVMSGRAQQAGPFNGTLFSTSSIVGFSQGWTNSGDIVSSDDTYASFGNLPDPSGTYTDYLVVTGFGFSIPSNATISGIVVDVERADPNGLTSDYSIRIVKDAMIGSSEKSSGLAYPVADAYQSYGGITDLWGEGWSHKEISSAFFGVAIAAQRNASGGTTAGRIDHVRITVFYQFLVTLPVKLTSFTATKNNAAVYIKWVTEEESGIDHYEVERSVNGRDFTSLGEVVSRNSTITSLYTYADITPHKATSWYRLKIVTQSGTVKNSPVVSIRFDENQQHYLYPSLLQPGQSLYIANGQNKKLTICFFNTSGQNIATITTTDGQISALGKSRGTYYYKIIDPENVITGSGKIVLH